jgi:thiamine monophosphate synthase
MTIPEDVFDNTSDEMSAVIASVLDDDELDQPATLASVREAILAQVKTVTLPLNRFSSDEWQGLRDEIDALIDEYDADALAVRFLRPWASEALQRLIEAGLDELGDVTLGNLFEAMEAGLLAQLIGQGEIDDDEAQTVIAELQNLIDRHGADALVEDFLGSP